jgi:hypothetical protein
VLEKKVAVPSLLKTDCDSEPYLITTLVVFFVAPTSRRKKVAVPSLLKKKIATVNHT